MEGKWRENPKIDGFLQGGWWILALCDRKRMVNDGDVQASDA